MDSPADTHQHLVIALNFDSSFIHFEQDDVDSEQTADQHADLERIHFVAYEWHCFLRQLFGYVFAVPVVFIGPSDRCPSGSLYSSLWPALGRRATPSCSPGVAESHP